LGADELKSPNLKTALFLIDSRTKAPVAGKMIINGQPQSLSLAPFYLAHPDKISEACYEMFSKLRFQHAAELNQWYMAEIPLPMLRAGKNEIVVAPDPAHELNVNGSPRWRYLQGNYVNMPSLTEFSPTLLMNDLNGFDARPRQTIYIASGKGRRIDCTADQNPDSDYEKTNLNTLVLLVYEQAGSEDGSCVSHSTAPSPSSKANSTSGEDPATISKPMDLFRDFIAPH
jgi:hypothetical protein